MRRRASSLLLASLVILVGAGEARAGMPSITLTDMARARLQTISFFLICFLACSWVIQRIWNSFRGDFPRLPRLGFGKALGVVTLWGLLFLLVLTMISGARELMTPGAWKKQGFTYALDEGRPPPDRGRDIERRRALERLRVALWTYARGHGGRFPKDAPAEVPEEAWRVPDPSGMRYLYVGGQEADVGGSPLAYEPDIFEDPQLVLLTNGVVTAMDAEAIHKALAPGKPR